MRRVFINRVATSVPPHDVHATFISFATDILEDPRMKTVLHRVASRSGIEHRYSYLQMKKPLHKGSIDASKVFRPGHFPSTGARMQLFEKLAPRLAFQALDALRLTPAELGRIRHVIVTCCTGFYAPGLDFNIVDHLGLPSSVERTMIGFMGCYAAMNALKLARHIVRSEPQGSVLIVNLELCTLHLQETQNIAEMLSFLIFGDGCSASLVSSDATGLEISSFTAFEIPGTRELISWRIGESGFDMMLSGQVPNEIGGSLSALGKTNPDGDAIDLWAIHPGGRSVLDAVETSLSLTPDRLRDSRAILSCYGNMSSATIMFVLEEMMKTAESGQKGCAMSFGPGLAAETMYFDVA
jgi:alpha-pyrone synthase